LRIHVVVAPPLDESLGFDEKWVEAASSMTVKDVLSLLGISLEAEWLKGVRVLVDGREAGLNRRVKAGTEIVLAPIEGYWEGRVVDDTPSLDALTAKLRRAYASLGAGAVVVFIGFVKGVVDENRVYSLDYEAYEPYASDRLKEIAASIVRDFGVYDVRIYHRVGCLKPGETTIYIMVVGRSRKEAFDAARAALEKVKEEVPIWKLEKRKNGDFWIVGKGRRVKRG